MTNRDKTKNKLSMDDLEDVTGGRRSGARGRRRRAAARTRRRALAKKQSGCDHPRMMHSPTGGMICGSCGAKV